MADNVPYIVQSMVSPDISPDTNPQTEILTRLRRAAAVGAAGVPISVFAKDLIDSASRANTTHHVEAIVLAAAATAMLYPELRKGAKAGAEAVKETFAGATRRFNGKA